jgi:hypothetical protein
MDEDSEKLVRETTGIRVWRGRKSMQNLLRISDNATDIRTVYIPNTNQEHYHYVNLLALYFMNMIVTGLFITTDCHRYHYHHLSNWSILMLLILNILTFNLNSKY